MDTSSLDRLPLRERKKIRTRIAIQEHALRLFAEQGYDATTVEQIAAAAEVSPSTFFRYFPTKEDTVLTDEYDPLMIEEFRKLPPDTDPVAGLREVILLLLGEMGDEERERILTRLVLVQSVPALRARSWDQSQHQAQHAFATMLAERLGRPEDDWEIQVFCGALVGGIQSAITIWAARGGTEDLSAVIGGVFDFLRSGCAFSPRPSPPRSG